MIPATTWGKKEQLLGFIHFQFEASADTKLTSFKNLRNSATSGATAFSAITSCFIHAQNLAIENDQH